MTNQKPSWGVVSMVKATSREIMRFAAHHLDLGAAELYIYLDQFNRRAFRLLREHPKIRVIICDDGFWERLGQARPDQQEVRQMMHATSAYIGTERDWLIHLDVDEFLWSPTPIADHLAALPPDIVTARVRPVEALAGGDDLFKVAVANGAEQQSILDRIYPAYGKYVRGGFLSHVQGKVFVRTGIEGLNLRIHNAYLNKAPLPQKTELPEIDLCHRHAPNWRHWKSHFDARMTGGAYREGLTHNLSPESKIRSLNSLFRDIEATEGPDGLRSFYREISAEDPAVLNRLKQFGLVKHRPLALDRKIAKHFPDAEDVLG